ncbi:hypothetical protein GCM10009092_42800 [Bowmanella denitrificans]|uniref:Tetratricopeptide repeat protein n=1 Tax=Bowmanella denitrificans TaxID=366582 RepID=A0ABN0XVI1_9ALTE
MADLVIGVALLGFVSRSGLLAVGKIFMSVVNKMLQDLEKRQVAGNDYRGEYQPPARRRSLWWLFGVLPLGLLLLLSVWLAPHWLDFSTAPTPYQGSEQPQPQPQSQPTANTEAQSLAASIPGEDKPEAPIQPAPQQSAPNSDATENAVVPEPDVATSNVAEPIEQKRESTPKGQLSISARTPERDRGWAELKARAKIALDEKRNADAERLLMQMLEMRPDAHGVRQHLAELLFAQGKSALARKLLEDGLQQDADDYRTRLMLARLLIVEKLPEQALTVLMAKQPALVSGADYYALRGQIAQQQGMINQAVADYQRLTQFQPDKPEWRLGLAVSLDQMGQFAEARAHYLWLSRDSRLSAPLLAFVEQRLRALGEE